MNKLYEYDYYKQKLKEKYDKCTSGNSELALKALKRFKHSEGAVDMAIKLIQTYNFNVDIEKAKICAILHDYAKFCSLDEFEEIKEEYNLDVDVSLANIKVLHAILGRYIVSKELNIDDEEILNAIETHTTGNSNMSELQEIIYLADCIEEGREEEYFCNLRNIAKHNYKKAIALSLKDTIERITLDDTKILHPYTLNAFKEYRKYLLNGNTKYERILSALDHNLIKDVNVYDTRGKSPYFDYIIVCTSLSSKQMQACLTYLRDDFTIRGSEIGDAWTLIDLDDIVIHIFKEEERERYGLDRLYAVYPKVDIK